MLKAMQRHLGAGAPERVLAIGGSTRNQLLMRLKATAYGAPLAVLDLPDTTCLGAALLGGLAAGVFPTSTRPARRLTRAGSTSYSRIRAGASGQRAQRQAALCRGLRALRPLHARLLDG